MMTYPELPGAKEIPTGNAYIRLDLTPGTTVHPAEDFGTEH